MSYKARTNKLRYILLMNKLQTGFVIFCTISEIKDDPITSIYLASFSEKKHKHRSGIEKDNFSKNTS